MQPDNLEQTHDRIQMRLFSGVSIGSLGLVAQELCELLQGPAGVYFAIIPITLLGWGIVVWSVFSSTKLAQNRGSENILQDERFAQIRAKSFEFGFAVLLALQVVLMVLNVVFTRTIDFSLTVSFTTTLSICVALTASFGRFVFLNR